MFGLGFGEVVLILIIALVFIGPKKLPELAKGLGRGLREFQNAAKGFQDQITKEVDEIKPKFDPSDLPSVEAIKHEIMTDAHPGEHNHEHDHYHDNWHPSRGEIKTAETVPEVTPDISKKPESTDV